MSFADDMRRVQKENTVYMSAEEFDEYMMDMSYSKVKNDIEWAAKTRGVLEGNILLEHCAGHYIDLKPEKYYYSLNSQVFQAEWDGWEVKMAASLKKPYVTHEVRGLVRKQVKISLLPHTKVFINYLMERAKQDGFNVEYSLSYQRRGSTEMIAVPQPDTFVPLNCDPKDITECYVRLHYRI